MNTTTPEISFDSIVMKWNDAKKRLDAIKAEENELRQQVFEMAQFKPRTTGVQTLELGHGYQLKGEVKKKYKLDNTDDRLWDILGQIGKPELTKELVKWKPELKLTFYKTLNDEDKALIDSSLTTDFATPTIKLIEPKK